jgi:hypothetical protein
VTYAGHLAPGDHVAGFQVLARISRPQRPDWCSDSANANPGLKIWFLMRADDGTTSTRGFGYFDHVTKEIK